jgi:dihydrofolate reductase
MAMRKLRVFESISLDGYFTDGIGGMAWAHRPEADADAEFTAWVGRNARSGGELLLGRVTYDLMAAWWPTPMAAEAMPEVAAGMNGMLKHIASRDAGFAPTWANSRTLGGDAVAAVRALKATAGADLALLGSGGLAAQLGAAGLVDDYQFVIIPVALGAGRTVFTSAQKLTLVEQRAFTCGNVVVTYVPA